jgi:hypothetical protein
MGDDVVLLPNREGTPYTVSVRFGDLLHKPKVRWEFFNRHAGMNVRKSAKMSLYHRAGLVLWLGTSLLFVGGCSGGGGSAEQKPTIKVSGTITMAGGAVADAVVTFSPQEGQPVAFGRTDSQGKYTLMTYQAGDGAVAGKYIVLVTKSSGASTSGPDAVSHEAFVSGQAAVTAHTAGGRGGSTAPGSILPEKYAKATTSDLTTLVSPEKMTYDFELQP